MLKGVEAQRMNGSSKITFLKKRIGTEQTNDMQVDRDDLTTKLKWLKQTAGQHSKLGNKLLTTAKRMKSAVHHREEGQAAEDNNEKLIGSTIHSYIMLAAKQAKKRNLTEDQKKQMKGAWLKKRNADDTAKPEDEEDHTIAF